MNQYYVYLIDVPEPVEVFASKYDHDGLLLIFRLEGAANGGETASFKDSMVKGVVLKATGVKSQHLIMPK